MADGRGAACALIATVSALLIGCVSESSPTQPAAPVVPRASVVASIAGDGQRATILAGLRDSLVVSVRDQRGLPLAGVTVDWAVDSAGGALSPQQGTTDEQGRASARWVFGVAPGPHRAIARVDGLPPTSFTDTAVAAVCPIPDDLSPEFSSLARTKQRLRSGAGVTIVAIGSSSTEGVGAPSADASYPSRLAAELTMRFPGESIRVLNKGVSGESAQQMLARFQRDVFANSPDLVIWQTGTIEAIGSDPIPQFMATLGDGAQQIRGHAADLLLMDSQFYPGVGESKRYRDFQDSTAAFSRRNAASLVPRYALMERYTSVHLYPLAELLASDSFHPSALTYRCLGEYIAAGLGGS